MDFEGLLPLLVFGWLIISWLTQRSRAGRQAPEDEEELQEPGELEAPPSAPTGRSRVSPARQRQLEARRKKAAALEELRRELERQFGLRTGEEHGPLGRRGIRLPDAEEVEERETLEVEPVVITLGGSGVRADRPVFDHDRGAEALIAKRVRAAEARLTGRTRADHKRFDEIIRQPAAPAAGPAPVLRSTSLRQAVMWREVLGPPKALQEDVPFDRLF